MFKRVKSHSVGLDLSGPCKVLPPTFDGVKKLVERYGEASAKMQFSKPDDVEEDESRGIVRDFLTELSVSDKVERQTLIRDFQSYVQDLEKFSHQDSGRGGAGAPEPEPTQEAKAKGSQATEGAESAQ